MRSLAPRRRDGDGRGDGDRGHDRGHDRGGGACRFGGRQLYGTLCYNAPSNGISRSPRSVGAASAAGASA